MAPDRAAAHRERLPRTETANVGGGLHYIQEDQPRAIGGAIADGMDRRGS